MSDDYPSHPDTFVLYSRRYRASSLYSQAKTVEGVSASNWTDSHLYLLRVVIAKTELNEKSKSVPQEARQLLRDAEAHLNENTRLQTVLEAVTGKEHHFPPPRILKILHQKGVREGISFFVSMRDLLEPKSRYTLIQHDNDELAAVEEALETKPSKSKAKKAPRADGLLNYTFQMEGDGPNTRAQTKVRAQRASEKNVQSLRRGSTDMGKRPALQVKAELAESLNIAQPQMAEGALRHQDQGISMISSGDDAEKERLKDELVTTGMVKIFVSLLFTLYYEFIEEKSEGNGDPPSTKYRNFTIAQKSYHVQTKFGDYNSKTDGGVYEILFDGIKCWPVDHVSNANIVDMEAKAAGISETLPQHVAELLAHIFARLKMFYNAREFQDYGDLSDTQRTVYLFCFHQTNFRVLWATFTPEYLEFLFGSPHDTFGTGDSTTNQAAKSKTKQHTGTTKPIQQLYASKTLSIIFERTRKIAAIIILALGLLNQNHGDVVRNSQL
ncbi:hypothetical protein K443DRAFT_92305 [Laccaria amethystina LaAM-08-1]|uniref:Uncharacterized protein n=1 Tax=Laccaria amethystina LaAM-08-1 TaxID=1095629 RepID=A0A0C9XSZ8_9AGAR|nr:hypothetical protein K443DRAFT_92305 [Laccaria amethystina LaAM-08-1]